MKEQEKKLKELIKPLEYLKKITTEEEMREYIKSRLTKYSVDYLIPIKTNTFKIKAKLLPNHQHQNVASCIMTNIPPRIEPLFKLI